MGGLQGAIIGLIAGGFAGIPAQRSPVANAFVDRGFNQTQIVLGNMAIAVVFIWLVGAVFGGLTGTVMKVPKVVPNQALRLSLLNACVTGPAVGLFFGLIALLIGAIVGGWRVTATYGLYGV
jgi:hypothetical protein